VYSSPSRYCSSTIAPAREAASARSTASASSPSARTSVTPALGGAVHRLHDDGAPELVERLLGLLEARRLASLRAAHLALLEGRAHPALVGDRARGLDRQARQAEPLGELRGGEDGLVGAHRRDRDRLDPCASRSPSTPPTSVKLRTIAWSASASSGRVWRAVHDADLVSEGPRLL
jgi:hypothetical protein